MRRQEDRKKLLLRNMPRGARLSGLAAFYPDTDPGAMEAYGALLEISSEILAASNSALARRGMSQARFRLMLHLHRAGAGGLHPMDLASALGVERATVTGLVDGIEKDGLARRLPCRGDRRSILVALTPKGTRLMNGLAPERLRGVSLLMSALSAAEKKELVRLLDKVGGKLAAFAKI
ncbi:MAG: MarR family transcriptional regulator [Elusimicrobia bacterium]|nr:MarR family transcriptional regulator [Elusimicrobiota bacterium]